MGASHTVRELEKARQAELDRILEKSGNGKALTAGERKLLDAEIEARRAPELRLEAGVEFRNLQEAADAYGYSLRQVKNWKKDGRKASDACPLDHPAEMPAWFERVYAPRECPDRLRDAVQVLLEGKTVERGPAGPVRAPAREVREDEIGFDAMLQRARRREAMLALKLEEAQRLNEASATQIETQLTKATGALLSLEKQAPAILEAQGVFLRRDEVKDELHRLASAIPKGLKQELRKRRRQMVAAETPEDFEEVLEEAVEAACRELCEADFADALELELAS